MPPKYLPGSRIQEIDDNESLDRGTLCQNLMHLGSSGGRGGSIALICHGMGHNDIGHAGKKKGKGQAKTGRGGCSVIDVAIRAVVVDETSTASGQSGFDPQRPDTHPDAACWTLQRLSSNAIPRISAKVLACLHRVGCFTIVTEEPPPQDGHCELDGWLRQLTPRHSIKHHRE
jgi:hypothetical protein